MQIIIGEETFEMDNDRSSLEQLFQHIDNAAQKDQLIFSHVVVNDVEIYQDPYTYLQDHLDEVETVDVKLQTMKELTDASLLDGEAWLAQALPLVEQLADGFYQGGQEAPWSELAELLEGMQWLIDLLDTLEQNPELYASSCTVTVSQLRAPLEELEQAVAQADAVFTGDVVKYEIVPMMHTIQSGIQSFIDSEVKRHDVH